MSRSWKPSISTLSESLLSDIADTLKEVLKWTRFAGMQQLKGIVSTSLENDVQKLVFELSNGQNSTRDIAKIAGLGSKSSVERYWEKWAKLGIVQPSSKIQGRMQRICSLEELGIETPKDKKEHKLKSEIEDEIEGESS